MAQTEPAVWAQVEQGVVPHLDAVMASVWALVRSGPNFDGRAADVERALWEAFDSIRAEERARCASICDGIGATYTGEARRLQGQHATHAAGRRDGANECAAEIRRA